MTTPKIIQFGWNVKVPEGIPLVDCRAIPNPYSRFGQDKQACREAVRSHFMFETLVDHVVSAIILQREEVVGVGCGYGVHRSGEVVEEAAKRIREQGWQVEVEKIGKR